jgi:hypothetical protein
MIGLMLNYKALRLLAIAYIYLLPNKNHILSHEPQCI